MSGLVLVAASVACWSGAVVLTRRHVHARFGAAPLREPDAEDLPLVIDLLECSLRSGVTVPGAVAFVGEWGPRSWGGVFASVGDAHARGGSFDDALDSVARAVPRFQMLANVLRGATRSGAAVAPLLAVVAEGARHDVRRRAEARARRVPVLLLFPLVGCFLPAFVCLVITPALLGAFEQLSL